MLRFASFCRICEAYVLRDYLHICCHEEQQGSYKHENVEQAMDVAFMHAEHRCAEQAGYKPREVDKTCCRRNAFWREIRREERRKHQSPDDKGGCDGHLSEYVEAI